MKVTLYLRYQIFHYCLFGTTCVTKTLIGDGKLLFIITNCCHLVFLTTCCQNCSGRTEHFHVALEIPDLHLAKKKKNTCDIYLMFA